MLGGVNPVINVCILAAVPAFDSLVMCVPVPVNLPIIPAWSGGRGIE